MKQRKENKIIADHGNWLEIDVSTAKHPAAVMKIDKHDWESIKSLGYGRAYAMVCSNDKSPYVGIHLGYNTTQIHRLIITGGKCVDHINHDGLDNRRSNIRGCSMSQNQMNRVVNKKTASGFKGVAPYKKTGLWRARIHLGGKSIHIGYYSTLEDAVSARKNAEKTICGEFCYA